MGGVAGTTRRRRIITAEFLVGFVLGVVIGGILLANADSAVQYVVGLVVLGIGVNYLPLSWHALQMSVAGRRQAELEGVDKAAELRRYSVLQLLVAPFLFLCWADWRGR